MNDCWLHITKADCCECPGLTDPDLDVKFRHWADNFEFQGWALKYDTLDAPGSDSRLCLYGRCRICGKRLCSDMTLATKQTVDQFLSSVRRWVYEVWKAEGYSLPESCKSFNEMFLTIFHEADKVFIGEWLTRPENQDPLKLR